jgi:hexosaminidase
MSRSRLIWKVVLLGMLALLIGSATAQPYIIPTPTSMTTGSGNFVVPATVTVYCDAPSDSVYPWIQKLFTQAGVAVQKGAQASAQIIVTRNSTLSNLTASGASVPEGYTLAVTTSTITISSASYAGQFYAVQTLRQLLPPGIEKGALASPINIPVVTISDKPQYQYRGNMLDVARHWTYATIPYLKQHLDRMSLYKLNTFHWHLGDDQGWRVQMSTFPTLTSLGGQSQVIDPYYNEPAAPANANYFYTQAQIADLINFAAVRNITIIPEFDMPGHTGEMTYSLARLKGCSSPDYSASSMYTGIETNWSALCLTGSGSTAGTITYTDSVLKALFKEISGIFPSKYLSVGGDEATNISGTVFSSWIGHMETTFTNNSKYMIGWEEIAAGRKLPTTWSIAWNTTTNGDIMARCSNEFIDHANSGSDTHAMGWCETEVTLYNVYSTPVSSANKGVECCLWSEYVHNDSIADIRLFPRMLATSEVGWAASNNSYSIFETHVAPQGARLDDMGVHWFSSAYDNGGTPTWVRATPASSSYTSVFGTYVYTYTPTEVSTPMILNSSHTQAIAVGKIIDLRGRVVGTMTNHGPEMNAVHNNISRGIYFIVNEKGNSVQSPKKLFVNE